MITNSDYNLFITSDFYISGKARILNNSLEYLEASPSLYIISNSIENSLESYLNPIEITTNSKMFTTVMIWPCFFYSLRKYGTLPESIASLLKKQYATVMEYVKQLKESPQRIFLTIADPNSIVRAHEHYLTEHIISHCFFVPIEGIAESDSGYGILTVNKDPETNYVLQHKEMVLDFNGWQTKHSAANPNYLGFYWVCDFSKYDEARLTNVKLPVLSVKG